MSQMNKVVSIKNISS